jgi:hypothetical protein
LWFGAVNFTRNAPTKEIPLPPHRAATACWRKEKPPIPPIIGAADTWRRRYRNRSRIGHPGLQQEGCSFPTRPLQACRSRHRFETGPRNSSSLRHIRWQWQVPPLWNPGSLRSYPNMNSRQKVSHFGPLM